MATWHALLASLANTHWLIPHTDNKVYFAALQTHIVGDQLTPGEAILPSANIT